MAKRWKRRFHMTEGRKHFAAQPDVCLSALGKQRREGMEIIDSFRTDSSVFLIFIASVGHQHIFRIAGCIRNLLELLQQIPVRIIERWAGGNEGFKRMTVPLKCLQQRKQNEVAAERMSHERFIRGIRWIRRIHIRHQLRFHELLEPDRTAAV